MSATSAGSSTAVSATAPNFALTLVYAFLDESPCRTPSESAARLVLGGNLTCTSSDKSVLADPWHFQWSFTASTAQLAGFWARDGAKVTTFANQPRPTITGGSNTTAVDIFDVAVVAPSSIPATRTDSVVFNVTLPCPTKLDDASRGDLATTVQPATWAMQFAASQVSFYVIGQAGTNQSQALRDQVVRKSLPASAAPVAPLTYVATASASTGGSSASSSRNSNSSTATASLVAIVLLSIGVALLVVVILLCLRRRRGSKSSSTDKSNHESTTTTTARGHGPGNEVWRPVPATSSIPSSPAPVARTMAPNMDAAISLRGGVGPRPGSWIEQRGAWPALAPEPTSPQVPLDGPGGYWGQHNMGPQFPRIDSTGPPVAHQMQMQMPQYDDRVEQLSPRSNWAPAPPPPPPQPPQQQPAWSPRAQPSRFDPVSAPPQMTLAPSPFQNPRGWCRAARGLGDTDADAATTT
ncbi:hypothetical protein AMAG_03741 [Allomyces macrogynus ATCC 38327]|uniref:Uncharacterized protein n=1 Tax=Allomyces macrogynus (strain ATCC 38327) TaxID=578462 RepID=A0A0L0SA88_ALLM3|nr:hypothetical protein AMAG_03741 [Allomyces macrogynus ATCC 38327]|eukprot:KNE59463.1 hypothetical protein AMAG_03741 [Allomyces macrogynus ATCC 38327]